MTSVAFVIVNFNGEAFLEGCLQSIREQTRRPDQVIVVDNNSTDLGLRMVEERFPEVEIVRLEQNLGFPAACNLGIRSTSAGLVAILNNDVVLHPLWLESLLRHDRPEWDFWASRVVFATDPARIDSAGDAMAVVGSAYKIGHGDDSLLHDRTREVFGPCAAAALYRRELLDQVGGFDPDFFLIYEDADLNMRARLLGARCLYVPEAIVYHLVNASIGTFTHNYVYFGHRNSEVVFWKNMPLALLLLYLPERLMFNLICCVFFWRKGRLGSFLSAKRDFLQHLPAIWRKRRRVQKNRRVSPSHFRKQLDRNWLRYRGKPVLNG